MMRFQWHCASVLFGGIALSAPCAMASDRTSAGAVVSSAIEDASNLALLRRPILTKVHFVVGTESVAATLDDTPAGRDFVALLPLNVVLRDYHATEKIADLPRRLSTKGAPASYAPKEGDITYYAPWGNLAIFYKPFQDSTGLIRLGRFDGPIAALLKQTSVPVRIESAELKDHP